MLTGLISIMNENKKKILYAEEQIIGTLKMRPETFSLTTYVL